MQNIKGYNLVSLTSELTVKYGEQILDMLHDIEGAHFEVADLLIEEKEGRIFHNKWKHSFVLLDAEVVIAVLFAYERESEENTNYTEPSIYINQLAVQRDFRGKGIGKALLSWFFETQTMSQLPNTGTFSVQTNSAEWNAPVQRLYESLGFDKVGEKQYPKNLDSVYMKRK